MDGTALTGPRPADERGFSLVEVVVAVALLGVVLTAWLGPVVTGQRTIALAAQRQVAAGLVSQSLEAARVGTCPTAEAGSAQSRGVTYAVERTATRTAAGTGALFTLTAQARWTSAASSGRTVSARATTVVYLASPTC